MYALKKTNSVQGLSPYSHSVVGNPANVHDFFDSAAHSDEFEADFSLVEYGADGVLSPLSSRFQAIRRQRWGEAVEAAMICRNGLWRSGRMTLAAISVRTTALTRRMMAAVGTSVGKTVLLTGVVVATVPIARIMILLLS